MASAQQPDIRKEAALGTDLAREIRKTRPPRESAAAKAYVERIGQWLAGHMPGEPRNWSFELLAERYEPVHEPLAISAGFIFVPAALVVALARRVVSDGGQPQGRAGQRTGG